MNVNSHNPDSSPRRKPRLLFVGEGPHDIGREDDPGGALAGFLHASLEGPGVVRPRREWPFEVAHIRKWTSLVQQLRSRDKASKGFSQLMKQKPDGRRLVAAMLVAASSGWDGIVLMKDCERTDNIGLGDDLRIARQTYSAGPGNDRPLCIIATPCRSHETWLLADGDAVREALDDEGVYPFSRSPEERPASDVLKRHLSDQAERLRREEVAIRRQLAFAARPAELRRRCPRCYPGFEADVRAELIEGLE